ncbi:ABC transporter [Phlyctema vagabunda]|uniref:ABC transporter n=1 Tax=Phlyctema vagabunda TaxID=108571 RepID=A0ABR4PNF0_9HELO
MNSLFKRGYSKVISFDDLGPIDDSLKSAKLHQRIQDTWLHQNRHTKWPLLRCLWTALRWSILSPVLPRLCYSAFLFAQPFLINQATTYLSRQSSAHEDNIGYGLIGASASIYLGIAISNALFKHQLYRHITMVRGSLVSLIYTQSLSMEDRIDDPSAAITLMSTDVDRICQSLVLLHDLWSRPLELVLGISLLALQIGWICIMPVAVVLLSAAADSRVALSIGNKVKIWTEAVQRRISLTADVLSSMKSVKMLGLAQPLRTLLQAERLRELRLQAKFRWSTVWLNTLGNVPPAITAAVTFIAFAIKAHISGSSSLTTPQVFTSLALINLVTTPASELLAAFPFVASCLGCLGRIEEHLTRPPRSDHRSFTTAREPFTTRDNEKTQPKENKVAQVASLKRVKLSMLGSSTSLLDNLDLEVDQNTFTTILGPSGSGKSTLLKAMLGEAKYGGDVSICISRIAYCPQIPWLFTGTLRQNICGMGTSPIDEAWYKSVINACALNDVLETSTYGDNTRIEGQTSSLSGGQKQRLILARSLYQRPQLLLLDDIFSALDVKTETQIMKNLFGTDGILLKLQAAVILVTHTRRWDKFADNIITLDGAGNATKTKNVTTQRLDMDSFSDDSEIPKQVEVSRDQDVPQQDLFNNGTNADSGLEKTSPRNDGEAMDYVYYFRSVRWPLGVMFLSFAAAQAICFYMSQIILVWWTASHGSSETKWLTLYILLAFGNAVMYGCAAWNMFLKLVPDSAVNIHRMLLDTVMNAPYSFFTKSNVGTILNRFSQDMSLIESQLPTGVLCTTIYFFWTIGSLALISTGSSWMALTVPVVLVALFFVQRVYLRTSRRLRTIELELRSPVYANFMETLKGLSTIRTLKWEDQFTDIMIEKLDSSQVPYYLLYCAQRWLQLVLDMIVAGLVIVVMTLAVRLRSSTDPGTLGLSLNNILSFNEIMSLLLQFWTQLEISLGAIARTREFSSQTPAETKPRLLNSISDTWPEYGAIEIRDLSARYTARKTALNNITMSIRPREKIGICGRSGSGKSSLLSALLRLLEPTNGSIVVDDVDLTSLHHQTVRECLLAVPQDVLILQHTIRYNLDPQARYGDEQLVSALAKVSLWPMLEKRGGLNMTITADSMSQGEKQLFSLARTILRKEQTRTSANPSTSGGVLLLDEATSNIDKGTDTLMQRVIRDEFSTFTIVIVAHRLETIMDSDRIAVLESGRLVEFDAPDALLSRDSAFSALYEDYKRGNL